MLLRTFRRRRAGRTQINDARLWCRSLAMRSLGALAVMAAASAANAQYFGGYNPCNPCQTVCAPVCNQTAMIVQPAYQTVPVTEYRQVKQTVMKPVTETKYVNRQVTRYRPVTEKRTASVPVTTYQPVTQMRTVMQNRSYYKTNYIPNCRPSPCAYDSRQGFLGWLNRTGYQIRSAFTPRYTAQRQYVPNMVAMQVPTTRYVAQKGARQVTYNVTKYEPYTTTHRVAVTETHMVAETHLVNQPVTTYRTVPVGTTVAYAPVGSAVALGGTISSVAYGPIQYGSAATATASRSGDYEPVPSRTAERTPAPGKDSDKYKRPNEAFGDPPKAPAQGKATPRGPHFRHYSAAERQRVLEARRAALQQSSPLTPADRVASNGGLDFESALASAFGSSRETSPVSIDGIPSALPEISGPRLIAPRVAAIQ